MRMLFEVIKFTFELLYSSYLHDVQEMKSDYHMESSPPDIEFVEEFHK